MASFGLNSVPKASNVRTRRLLNDIDYLGKQTGVEVLKRRTADGVGGPHLGNGRESLQGS